MCASEIRLLANEWQLRSGRVVFAFDITKCLLRPECVDDGQLRHAVSLETLLGSVYSDLFKHPPNHN